MELDFKVIQAIDIDELLNFDVKQLNLKYLDPEDLMFATWSSRARRESLEHYSKLGWSFKALNKNHEIQGFILAQPLLFLSGQTQSLWVEYLCSSSLQVQEFLLDLAYRLSREKHLQCVYFPQEHRTHLPPGLTKNCHPWEDAPQVVSLIKK